MIKKFNHQGITWIDVYAPTKNEVTDLAEEFKLHPLVASELLTPSLRSKVDVYENFIYLILHFPTCEICYGHDQSQPEVQDTQEIDFVIGEKFLLTTHYSPEPVLEEFSQILDFQTGGYRAKGKVHAGHLLFTILRRFYQSLEEGLLYINQSLKKTEANIFAGQEKEMVKVLSNLNRSLLDFRWALKNHNDVLSSFEAAGRDFFGENFTYYLRAIIGEYEKIWNILESNRETFNDLRSTNESLLSIKTNETMKTLTAVAFITLPLTLLGQIFGMSLISIPLGKDPNGFWIVLVIMAALAGIMFALAKHQRWL
ncbi:MAG: magnesium transporter CorA family protein [bacterium]|nr:magnesium transporter CorA family protein [bacterium]